MSPATRYPTASQRAQSSLGVSGVISHAADAVRADPRMLAVVFVALLLGGIINAMIPFIGNLFILLGIGIAVVMATETFDEGKRPEKSLDVRGAYLVVATLLSAILVGVGLLLVILPGIYLTVRFALVPAAVMVDDKGPIDALFWSWSRTKGHWLTVFGFMLVMAVPGILFVALLYVTVGFQVAARNPVLYSLVAGVLVAPFAALNAGGIAVMYAAFKD